MPIQDYFQTVLDFLKLEKVEFSGVKDRSFGEMVEQIYNDFQEVLSKFTNSTYNPLDVNNKVCVCCGGRLKVESTMQSVNMIHCSGVGKTF